MSYQLYIAKINLFCITYTSEVLPDTRPPQANILKILRPLTEKYMQNPLENSVSVFVLCHNSPKFSPAAGLTEGVRLPKPRSRISKILAAARGRVL